jgi:hypothetical protein
MTLQIRDIEALGPGVHQIGPRLYLKCVQREKGLSRHVLLRWTSGKRAEVKSLGAWQPELYGHFLAEARRAAEAKEQDRDVRLAMDERGAPGTFKEAAEGYMAANLPAFTNAKHRKRWRKLMEGTYATLGHLKVTQLEPGHIAKVLSPYWQRTPVQVMRVRSMIEQVIDYAIARQPELPQRGHAQRGAPSDAASPTATGEEHARDGLRGRAGAVQGVGERVSGQQRSAALRHLDRQPQHGGPPDDLARGRPGKGGLDLTARPHEDVQGA